MDVDELRQLATVGRPNRRVSIIQRSGTLAKHLNKSVRWTLLNAIQQAGITSYVNASVMSVAHDRILLTASDGAVQELPCDTIVVAAGIEAEDRLYRELKTRMPEIPVHLIGDAVAARQATEALLEAFEAASSI
jgi:2-enoate reductase